MECGRLETGPHQLKVLCAEVYNRDPVDDPHAESTKIHPSSLPTTGPATQYEGRLKIVQISDQFNNRKLVIGVRGYNYLITSGLRVQEAFVGPSRCAGFPINYTTKMYVRRKPQDANMLNSDILSLAQVGSGFGHIATYTPRRGALQGFGTIPLMPVPIFTLSQKGVANCNVFRQLAVRARERKKPNIVLHIGDVDIPEDSDHSKSAEVVRKLRKLFTNGKRIDISGNKAAEDLMELANIFSPIISDKNRTVAAKIISEVNGSYGISVAGIVVPALETLKVVDVVDSVKESCETVTRQVTDGVDQSISILKDFRVKELQKKEGSIDLQKSSQNETAEYMLDVKGLEGTDLRQLASYLSVGDSDNLLRNLYRTTTKHGYVEYVCKDHYREGYQATNNMRLCEAVKTARGVVDEQVGEAVVTIKSAVVATPLYEALLKSQGIYEMDLTLAWNQENSDLTWFKVMIKKSTIVSLTLDLQLKTGPTFGIRMSISEKSLQISFVVQDSQPRRIIQTSRLLKWVNRHYWTRTTSRSVEVYGRRKSEDPHSLDLAIPDVRSFKVVNEEHDSTRQVMIGTARWNALVTLAVVLTSSQVVVGPHNPSFYPHAASHVWVLMDGEKDMFNNMERQTKLCRVETYQHFAAAHPRFLHHRTLPVTLSTLWEFKSSGGWCGIKVASFIFYQLYAQGKISRPDVEKRLEMIPAEKSGSLIAGILQQLVQDMESEEHRPVSEKVSKHLTSLACKIQGDLSDINRRIVAVEVATLIKNIIKGRQE
ncbi:hypothetical protein BGX27_009840 [Mortierella sp. AM989]|nr:hypothetical protein BGX27_009840 [Mortierella sp. AM989]